MRKWTCVAVALAGLTGSGGVILAAVAAHLVPDLRLQTAAVFLLLHAASTLAVCALALVVSNRSGWFLGAAGLFFAGSLLLAGDLSLRALAGMKLFPMAAPLGGMILIFGWAFAALAGVMALQLPCGKSHSGWTT